MKERNMIDLDYRLFKHFFFICVNQLQNPVRKNIFKSNPVRLSHLDPFLYNNFDAFEITFVYPAF